MRVVRRSLYEFPRVYDLVYGAASGAEFRFFREVFRRYATRRVRRVLEPACGTGRLLARFAKEGRRTIGFDLSEPAVEFARRRLASFGRRADVFVGDMADFSLDRPVDAAFCAINSFRHLPTEATARNHLRRMADAVAPGGVYVLCFSLTPTAARPTREESWAGRRGFLATQATVRSLRRDMRTRQEIVQATVDVQTPTDEYRIVSRATFRVHTAKQFQRTLAAVPDWEQVATFDFSYDVRRPIELNAVAEDVAIVLRRRS